MEIIKIAQRFSSCLFVTDQSSGCLCVSQIDTKMKIPYNRLLIIMRPRNLCVLANEVNFKCTWILFRYAWLYMGCGYPTIDINYAILVSLA